jgi:biopolymer transport protein ExbD
MGMGRFDTTGQREPMSEINTTPLVDVMLVLLVIFIITAPLMTRGVSLDLPKADNPVVAATQQTLTISLDAQGQLFVDKKPVTIEALRTTLETASKAPTPPSIQIRAARDTRYEDVVRVMTLASQLGLTQLAFVTESPTTPQTR